MNLNLCNPLQSRLLPCAPAQSRQNYPPPWHGIKNKNHVNNASPSNSSGYLRHSSMFPFDKARTGHFAHRRWQSPHPIF
jgi:hypothetical protein